jgi:hypothetical protein
MPVQFPWVALATLVSPMATHDEPSGFRVGIIIFNRQLGAAIPECRLHSLRIPTSASLPVRACEHLNPLCLCEDKGFLLRRTGPIANRRHSRLTICATMLPRVSWHLVSVPEGRWTLAGGDNHRISMPLPLASRRDAGSRRLLSSSHLPLARNSPDPHDSMP